MALVDLFLSYRPASAWDDMIRVADGMPEPLRRVVLVREQLAFALNRRARGQGPSADRERAIALLTSIEDEHGPNPETCGLLGRIYKDLWEERAPTDGPAAERELLDEAIGAYVRGVDADPRDPYPGINAVTLLEVRGDRAALRQRDRLLPLVRYAVEQRVRGTQLDYWDRATLLELAVLEDEQELAGKHLSVALPLVRERFQPETTARNLRLIQSARKRHGREAAWIDALAAKLEARAKGGP
jgi:hypothetical protein